MKNLKEINKIIQNHERRLTILERGGARAKTRGGKKSLSNHIVELRDQGFFKKPVTPEEVHKKLVATYPCDFSRVKVELIRLQKRSQLRKTSKLIGKKRYIAYVW